MQIAITGSGGFVGSFLTRRLLQHHPHSIRVLARGASPFAGHPRVEVCSGDLRSQADCNRFVSGVDVIYHLAHCNSPVNSDGDMAADTSENLIPTLNLIDVIRRRGRPVQVVYFSSGGAIYASPGRRKPFGESDPPCPTSSYGIQKLAAEHYLQLAAQRGELSATVLRIGNAFGTLLPEQRLQGFVGVAVGAAIAGRPVRVFGSTANVRDWVHLTDICSMAWSARTPRQPYAIVNVGSGVGHSVAEILAIIKECNGGHLDVELNPSLGSNLVDWVVLDVAKAESEFGWKPCIDLTTGIKRMFVGDAKAQLAF